MLNSDLVVGEVQVTYFIFDWEIKLSNPQARGGTGKQQTGAGHEAIVLFSLWDMDSSMAEEVQKAFKEGDLQLRQAVIPSLSDPSSAPSASTRTTKRAAARRRAKAAKQVANVNSESTEHMENQAEGEDTRRFHCILHLGSAAANQNNRISGSKILGRPSAVEY